MRGTAALTASLFSVTLLMAVGAVAQTTQQPLQVQPLGGSAAPAASDTTGTTTSSDQPGSVYFPPAAQPVQPSASQPINYDDMPVAAMQPPPGADKVAVVMEYLRPDGIRDVIGGVMVWDSPEGAVFKVVVTKFTPGFKGFHLLTTANCDPVPVNGRLELGGAAGKPLDPQGTGKHDGPFGDGYLGALPKTEANADGWIFMSLVAPRVRVTDLHVRALVLREYDDNYKNKPLLGGSGGIASCGMTR